MEQYTIHREILQKVKSKPDQALDLTTDRKNREHKNLLTIP